MADGQYKRLRLGVCGLTPKHLVWRPELRRCEICAADYTAGQKKAMYCSLACKLVAFKRKHYPELMARRVEKRIASKARKAAKLDAATRRAAQAVNRQQARLEKRATGVQCNVCGVLWCRIGRGGSNVCAPCAEVNAQEARAAYRAAGKARKRAATVESVSPRKVFERDGWCCYLCGCDTPKRLRGTYEANAPELEHVIPLARGGAHSYANTRCACRACNVAKGDSMPTESTCQIGPPRYVLIQGAKYLPEARQGAATPTHRPLGAVRTRGQPRQQTEATAGIGRSCAQRC